MLSNEINVYIICMILLLRIWILSASSTRMVCTFIKGCNKCSTIDEKVL